MLYLKKMRYSEEKLNSTSRNERSVINISMCFYPLRDIKVNQGQIKNEVILKTLKEWVLNQNRTCCCKYIQGDEIKCGDKVKKLNKGKKYQCDEEHLTTLSFNLNKYNRSDKILPSSELYDTKRVFNNNKINVNSYL